MRWRCQGGVLIPSRIHCTVVLLRSCCHKWALIFSRLVTYETSSKSSQFEPQFYIRNSPGPGKCFHLWHAPFSFAQGTCWLEPLAQNAFEVLSLCITILLLSNKNTFQLFFNKKKKTIGQDWLTCHFVATFSVIEMCANTVQAKQVGWNSNCLSDFGVFTHGDKVIVDEMDQHY